MVKFLTSIALPAHSPWRRFFCSDPERLDAIAAVHRANPTRVGTRAATEFSTIVSSIWIGGTQKRTRENRLPETNRCLCEHLARRHLGQIRFLDVGASDGITTWETVQVLQSETSADVQAVLLERYTRLLRYDSTFLSEYRTVDGMPVMVRMGRLALPLAKVEQSNFAPARWLGRRYLSRTSSRAAMQHRKSISLIHPLASGEPRIEIVEANAMEQLESLVDSVDAVRASNFLNHSYFSHEQIETALSHLFAYLREGGLLVVSRNAARGVDEIETGTLWAKQGNRFEHLDDFGGGSEIANIVDEFRSGQHSTIPRHQRVA